MSGEKNLQETVENMNEFKTYHPLVNFIYFVCVIGFACFLLHPICLCISLFCALSYLLLLKGKAAMKKTLAFLLPTMLVMALLNPAFNHAGVTVLAYFPNGNPLTLESVLYGLASAGLLGAVICWFSCYHEVMTSDKFMYLFGKIIPSLSLVFSMTLRFVPRFSNQFKRVINAQRCMGRDLSSGTLFERAKIGLSILSIMITWALENAIETAESMKARGYGQPGRTAFSLFSFSRRDLFALVSLLVTSALVLYGALSGGLRAGYFPFVQIAEFSFWNCVYLLAYAALCLWPILFELWEVRRWNKLRSKI